MNVSWVLTGTSEEKPSVIMCKKEFMVKDFENDHCITLIYAGLYRENSSARL